MNKTDELCRKYLELPSAEPLRAYLGEKEWKCNAPVRTEAEKIFPVTSRPLPENAQKLLELAAEIGGLKPGQKFTYATPFGENVARVCDLYDIPNGLVNPFMVCFSGHMGAPVFCSEALRFYVKKTRVLLPFLAIGKGGNKGLFESVFNREEGIIRRTEYETYLNIMEAFAPKEYVRKYQTVFEDMDTAGNLRELYRFAKEQGLKEVTYILITGQPWYDKRVLGEFMLPFLLEAENYKDVKVNFVLAHSPLWLDGNLPECHISEISLGYAAASIGPLLKDTLHFDGTTFSEKPERYNLLSAGMCLRKNWKPVEELITWFGNMGWPNYEELLYDSSHEKAVEHIILAHLFARASFTPESYDEAIRNDLIDYIAFFLQGNFCEADDEESFRQWCINSTDEKFFK